MLEPARNAIRLGQDEILRIDGGKGSTVRCEEGALWLTQDGDLRDLFLEAGQHYALDRAGPALISAYRGPVRLRVEPAAQRPLRMILSGANGSWHFRPASAGGLSGHLRRWAARWQSRLARPRPARAGERAVGSGLASAPELPAYRLVAFR